MNPASIALCHEWLAHRHGSEKTFEQMAQLFGGADLWALTYNPSAGLDFGGRPVHTTFVDRIRPLAGRRDLQLPLMPLAWRLATRSRYDLVVTSSHACAKGFRPGRSALHLCYCYTPMRYVWLPAVDSRRRANPVESLGRRALRRWDRRSTRWVDGFAGISNAVCERIERFYGRPARLIHPPVDTGFYTPGDPGARGGFALGVSRFVPYKRLDLAIDACAGSGIQLVLAGAGPGEQELRRRAALAGGTVEFVIDPTDAELRDLYRRAAVTLFPAEEDFGIVPVESQACGTPVVALARGGSLETVIDGVTGALVPAQSSGDLAAGIEKALAGGIDPAACRSHAERFGIERFRRELWGWVAGEAAKAGVELGAA